MIFFTWNLHRRDPALRLALQHLASLPKEFLACLQELPQTAHSEHAARHLAATLAPRKVQCLTVVGSKHSPGRVGLFSSVGISATQATITDLNTRMAMTVLKGSGWKDLQVVGIHALDRRNAPTDLERGGWALLTRQQMEAFWRPNRPLVVLGDFNADPYHPEVSARTGMFAIRDRSETRRAWKSQLLGGRVRPLYNPMWKLLPEDPSRPAGTFLLNTQTQGIRWRLCDQILVSPDLIERIDVGPKILARICNTKLTNSHGNPSARISDHLPIELSISL